MKTKQELIKAALNTTIKIYKYNRKNSIGCLYQYSKNNDFIYLVVNKLFIGLRGNKVEIFQPLEKFDGFPNGEISIGYISTGKFRKVLLAL